MERISVLEASKIFGKNFIGENELKPFLGEIGYEKKIDVPSITYSRGQLEQYSNDYILILGIKDNNITIRSLREHFGVNPDISEPCFYNQDWYLSEKFIDYSLQTKWYLLKKEVLEDSRSVMPIDLINKGIVFPSALLCTYTFFAYFYRYNKFLWFHDFIWCNDVDHNGDRVYIGKYNDIDGVNKNGFSIHRYLALRSCYAAINII